MFVYCANRPAACSAISAIVSFIFNIYTVSYSTFISHSYMLVYPFQLPYIVIFTHYIHTSFPFLHQSRTITLVHVLVRPTCHFKPCICTFMLTLIRSCTFAFVIHIVPGRRLRRFLPFTGIYIHTCRIHIHHFHHTHKDGRTESELGGGDAGASGSSLPGKGHLLVVLRWYRQRARCSRPQLARRRSRRSPAVLAPAERQSGGAPPPDPAPAHRLISAVAAALRRPQCERPTLPRLLAGWRCSIGGRPLSAARAPTPTERRGPGGPHRRSTRVHGGPPAPPRRSRIRPAGVVGGWSPPSRQRSSGPAQAPPHAAAGGRQSRRLAVFQVRVLPVRASLFGLPSAHPVQPSRMQQGVRDMAAIHSASPPTSLVTVVR